MEEQGFIERMSTLMHLAIKDFFPQDFVLIAQITTKCLFLLGIAIISLFIFRGIIDIILKNKFCNKEKYPIIYSLYQTKVHSTVAKISAVVVADLISVSVFQEYHPLTNILISRVINLAMVLLSARVTYKALKATIYYYEMQNDQYRVIALKAVSQTLRIIGFLVFTIIGISILFGIKGDTIFGYLSAFIAVFFLIFRDFILGAITGMNVALSKTYKVGDWIMIDKHNLEGTIVDISLLTTKVQNFDRTISTIPTYDLLNTEVKNFEVMKQDNKRRIKKSITFNINSFKFVDDELFNRLVKINLISDYLIIAKAEISSEIAKLSEHERVKEINSRQLTNIGVFRKYVEAYLHKNPKIDHSDTILARQLDITPDGLPLEIYCFTNFPNLVDFERVQADIFDHLLVASKSFDLEVTQFMSK